MDWVEVQCPSCFEAFAVPPPGVEEVPSEMDYDCEICCRPMVIRFDEIGGGVSGQAFSLDE